MDKFRALKAFCHVAETRSFAAAAFELGVAPSVLSKTISALEADLRFKLFHRTTRRVLLSEFGERYYENCRRLLAELEEAELGARQDAGLPKGRLRVGLHPGVNRLVMARLNEFFVQYPEIELDTTMSSATGTFLDDRLDVLVAMGELADSSLVAHKLGVTRHVLVASPAYLQREGAPIAPDQLRSHRFIVSGRPDGPSFGRWTFVRESEVETIYVPVRLVSRQGIFMHEAALSGLGIGRLAQISIQSHLDNGTLKLVLPDWSLPDLSIHALTPQQLQLPAKSLVFIEFVRKVVRDNLAPHSKSEKRQEALR